MARPGSIHGFVGSHLCSSGAREPKKPPKGDGGGSSDPGKGESNKFSFYGALGFTEAIGELSFADGIGHDRFEGGTDSLATDMLLENMKALDDFWLSCCSDVFKN